MSRRASSIRRRLLLLVGGLMGLWLANCSLDDSAKNRCSDDDDCLDGLRCHNGICSQSALGGAASPPRGNCEVGRSYCDAQCVDVQLDPRHCGDCDQPCAEGQVCTAQQCYFVDDCVKQGCPGFSWCDATTRHCRPGCEREEQCAKGERCSQAHECACKPGSHACEGACVDSSSTDHCGDSCSPCPTVENGVPSCDGSACGIACKESFEFCDGACVPCEGKGVAQTGCDGATCITLSCERDYVACETGCCADWHHTTLTFGAADVSTSIAVGADNLPRIAYFSHAGGGRVSLDLASWNGATWQTEKLVDEQAGSDPSLAIDDLGHAHTVHRGSSSLTYTRKVTASPETELMLEAANDIGGASIAVTTAAEVHLVYEERERPFDLRYALRTASGWQRETIISGSAARSPVVLDGQGRPCLVVGRPPQLGTTPIDHLCRVDGVWQADRIADESSDLMVGFKSSSFDNNGHAHVLYQHGDTLRYAHRDAAGWQVENVGIAGRPAVGQAIAVDSSSRPHIVFASDGQLHYARRAPGGWRDVLLLPKGEYFLRAGSIVVDGQDIPHVVYAQYDHTGTRIRYATTGYRP